MLCGHFGHIKQYCTSVVSTSMEETSSPTQLKTDKTQEGEWKTVEFTRKSTYTTRNSIASLDKAVAEAAPPRQQLQPGKFTNPTRPQLGHTSAENLFHTRPNKIGLNKFDCLSILDPIREGSSSIGTKINN